LKRNVESVEGTADEPTNANFRTVKEALKDKLLPAKLAFFQSVAEDVESFLREFQSEAPLAPFLYGSHVKLLKTLMQRFVKVEVLESTPLQKIDVLKKSGDLYVNLLSAKDIDLGIVTRAALRKCKKVSDLELLRFCQKCRTCLMFVVAKLTEKCLFKYPLTQALTFLNPEQIV